MELQRQMPDFSNALCLLLGSAALLQHCPFITRGKREGEWGCSAPRVQQVGLQEQVPAENVELHAQQQVQQRHEPHRRRRAREARRRQLAPQRVLLRRAGRLPAAGAAAALQLPAQGCSADLGFRLSKPLLSLSPSGSSVTPLLTVPYSKVQTPGKMHTSGTCVCHLRASMLRQKYEMFARCTQPQRPQTPHLPFARLEPPQSNTDVLLTPHCDKAGSSSRNRVISGTHFSCSTSVSTLEALFRCCASSSSIWGSVVLSEMAWDARMSLVLYQPVLCRLDATAQEPMSWPTQVHVDATKWLSTRSRMREQKKNTTCMRCSCSHRVKPRVPMLTGCCVVDKPQRLPETATYEADCLNVT